MSAHRHHRQLERQLQRLGITANQPPDPMAWEGFLSKVGQTYQDLEQDRYLLERSLAISNDELRQVNSVQSLILDNSTMGIAFVRHQLFEWVNRRLPELFGLAPSHLLGTPIRILFPDDTDYDGLSQAAYKRMGQGQKGELEVRFQRADGTPFWCRIQGNALHPSSPHDGSVWIWEDITARKEAEDELQRVHRIQSLILDNTAVGIAFVRHRVFEWVNPRLPEILRMPMSQVQGALTRILYPSDDTYDLGGSQNYEALSRGQWCQFEANLEHLGGTPHYCQVIGKALDPEHPQEGSIWIFEDITERRKSEEALRQGQKLESLGVLAGGIAHDFNNLLTAILGNLQLAGLELDPAHPAVSSLESAELAATKAADLTRQMLAYSGKGRFVVKPQNLNQVVQEMTKLMRVSIHKKVELAFELAPEPPLIEADGAQLQQVILNLVTNSSDAIGDHVGVLTVRTGSRELDAPTLARDFPAQNLKPGRYALLEVSDTGCGMPPEIRERIFDPFFTTKTTGRGLGLSAMLGILKGHRAGIAIDTSTDPVAHGTTFHILFPALTNPAPLAPPPAPEPQARYQGHMLIVDDEEAIITALTRILRTLGFTVESARDGREAIEHLQADTPFELVIMDLSMPRMGGREAFHAIRAMRPELPIILSSGYDEQQVVEELTRQGLAGFLPKPYRLQELRQIIAAALSKSKSLPETEVDRPDQA
ncbi:MAG TPA: response regulator [Holophaga sp.]|nr:response regulator [Holophaga sp.]